MFRIILASLFMLFSTATFAEDGMKIINIGTGSVTGVYYPTGGAICRLINKDIKAMHIRCLVEATEGSLANLQALQDKKIDFAIVQSDWAYNAYNGKESFKEAMPNLRKVVSLYDEAFTVIVGSDSGIKTIADLKGKKINIGSPSSGSNATFKALMNVMGWKQSDFAEITEQLPKEHQQLLCDKKVDAIIYNYGHPNASVQEVTKTCNAYILNIDQAVLASLNQKYPYYNSATIKGGLYPNNPMDIKTFGMKAMLVTLDSTNDDLVTNVTKSIIDNFSGFKNLHPVFGSIKVQDLAAQDSYLPSHNGAIKYFTDKKLAKQ